METGRAYAHDTSITVVVILPIQACQTEHKMKVDVCILIFHLPFLQLSSQKEISPV